MWTTIAELTLSSKKNIVALSKVTIENTNPIKNMFEIWSPVVTIQGRNHTHRLNGEFFMSNKNKTRVFKKKQLITCWWRVFFVHLLAGLFVNRSYLAFQSFSFVSASTVSQP
jgi:hypothetical protein